MVSDIRPAPGLLDHLREILVIADVHHAGYATTSVVTMRRIALLHRISSYVKSTGPGMFTNSFCWFCHAVPKWLSGAGTLLSWGPRAPQHLAVVYMLMPLPSVCSSRRCRSYRSCPDTTMTDRLYRQRQLWWHRIAVRLGFALSSAPMHSRYAARLHHQRSSLPRRIRRRRIPAP